MRPTGSQAVARGRDGRTEDAIAFPLVLVARLHGALLLRHQWDRRGQGGQRLATGAHHPQDLEGGDDPVARRRVLEDDDVAALLAAEGRAGHLHPLEDVLVADRGPDDLATGGLDRGLQAAVRQDGHDQAAARQLAAGQPVEGQDPEDLVAVDDAPVRIDRDEPVRIAVEGEADVGAVTDDGLRQRGRIGGPATDVDVDPVRIGVDHLDGRAGRLEDGRPERRARAVRPVEDDLQPAWPGCFAPSSCGVRDTPRRGRARR